MAKKIDNVADGALDRILVLELVRVTEAAAIAASRFIGRGDEQAADAAAAEAMHAALNSLRINGTIVIGEGARGEAPRLYVGEKVGGGKGPKIDVALDPLEGMTITAKGGPNALAVVALAQAGHLLHAPDTYMNKIAIGGGYPEGVIDLDNSVAENINNLAEAKGVAAEEIMACVLDRPRHGEIIRQLRALGCGVTLIPDGDVAGAIAPTNPETGIDILMGEGGAPEGVLAAAALRCTGGQFQGRLVFRNEDEKARARRAGIADPDRKYTLEDLASGDVIFAATGVTDGSFLKGVRRSSGGGSTTYSVVMRASSRTVRWVTTGHSPR